MENLIFDKVKNAEFYSNIFFCGGVLNSHKYPEMIRNLVQKLLSKENLSQVDLRFSSDKIKDNIYSFYKGANFLSKVENLEDNMISMQDYHENGKERLCIKFI